MNFEPLIEYRQVDLRASALPYIMAFTNITKLKSEDGSLYPCPCCGFRTLTERAGYEICSVCFWEDDGQDSHDADVVRGGPNGSLSLTQARQHFRECGASDPRYVSIVRPPKPEEL